MKTKAAVCFEAGKNLEIETVYGKLKVPIKDVHAIEFGVRLPPGAAEKIGQAVTKLASKDENERTGAGKALVELGPHSYQAVLLPSLLLSPAAATVLARQRPGATRPSPTP